MDHSRSCNPSSPLTQRQALAALCGRRASGRREARAQRSSARPAMGSHEARALFSQPWAERPLLAAGWWWLALSLELPGSHPSRTRPGWGRPPIPNPKSGRTHNALPVVLGGALNPCTDPRLNSCSAFSSGSPFPRTPAPLRQNPSALQELISSTGNVSVSGGPWDRQGSCLRPLSQLPSLDSWCINSLNPSVLFTKKGFLALSRGRHTGAQKRWRYCPEVTQPGKSLLGLHRGDRVREDSPDGAGRNPLYTEGHMTLGRRLPSEGWGSGVGVTASANTQPTCPHAEPPRRWTPTGLRTG